MKSYNIIYKNNKFYDAATNQRIYPKDGSQILIAGNDEIFMTFDPLNIPAETTLTSELKLEEVKKIKNLDKHVMILGAGTRLSFEFNLTKRKNEAEEMHYKFTLTLQEDLYLHSCSNWKPRKLPELCSCYCIVDTDNRGNVPYFEPIYAQSVNEALSKTRQFYFPNQGTPGASVYVTVKRAESNTTLEDIREHYLDFFQNRLSLFSE
jgi:hypothetical protein